MDAVQQILDEHRLILDMLRVVDAELQRVGGGGRLNQQLVDHAVEFLQVFVNEFHHGKEQRYLYSEFEKKNPTPEHWELMKGLAAEHRRAGELCTELAAARDAFVYQGQGSAVELLGRMRDAAEFFRGHFRKEEEVFFPVFKDYYSREDYAAAAAGFREFNEKFTTLKYTRVLRMYQ